MHGRDYVRNVTASIKLQSPNIGSVLANYLSKPQERGMWTNWAGTTLGSHYFNFGPAPFDFHSTPNTILIKALPLGDPVTNQVYGRLFAVAQDADTNGFMIGLEHDVTYTRTVQAYSYGTAAKKRHTVNNTYANLTPLTIALTNECTDAYTSFNLYINGILNAHNATGSVNGATLNTAAGDVVIGNTNVTSQDINTRQLYGITALVLVYDRALTATEIRELSSTPYRVFKPVSDTFAYCIGIVAGGSVNLTIQDALHNHVTDALVLSTDTYLSILEAVHSHNVDNLTISSSGSVDLAIQECQHAHSVENINLAVEWLLSIANASHSHISDNITLGLAGSVNLAIQNTYHSQQTEAVILTLASWLEIVGATHNHTAETLLLSLETFLNIQDSFQQHKAENCGLNTGGGSGLTLEEILAAVRADPWILTIPKWLALKDDM